MSIFLWVALAIVVANVLLATFLLLKFRAEDKLAAEARHRREESAHWVGPMRGSSHRHLA